MWVAGRGRGAAHLDFALQDAGDGHLAYDLYDEVDELVDEDLLHDLAVDDTLADHVLGHLAEGEHLVADDGARALLAALADDGALAEALDDLVYGDGAKDLDDF